jgi:hypothetical protein
MNEEYQLYLELKEKYGEFETEEQFWENQKLRERLPYDTMDVSDVPF